MKKVFIGLGVSVVFVLAIVYARLHTTHTFTFPAENLASPSPATIEPSEFEQHHEDWPQWRGARRDGIAGSTDLLDEWPEEGPPLVWTASGLGTGMSSVAVANEAVYTLGKREGKVWLVCLGTEDGKERWSTELGDGGEPNATPTIDGDRVFATTREGRIVCAKTDTGEVVWTRDFVADFGGSIPTWGYSESPLVEAGRVICTPGADDALIVALDRATGETIWKSSLPDLMQHKGHDGAGYSSPVVSHAAGVHHSVQMFGSGVIGVSATDGATLWGYSRVANSTAVIPTPIVQGDFVFVSSGYGTGAALLKLTRTASGIAPRAVYFHRGNRVQNHHGGMVLVDGHVYMGHGHNQGHPLCLELMTGKVKWGPLRGPGSGSAAVSFADGHLYFRYQNAKLSLVEATPSGYHLKSVFKLPSHLGRSWPHPALARKRLYLRDQDLLHCFNLAKPST